MGVLLSKYAMGTHSFQTFYCFLINVNAQFFFFPTSNARFVALDKGLKLEKKGLKDHFHSLKSASLKELGNKSGRLRKKTNSNYVHQKLPYRKTRKIYSFSNRLRRRMFMKFSKFSSHSLLFFLVRRIGIGLEIRMSNQPKSLNY